MAWSRRPRQRVALRQPASVPGGRSHASSSSAQPDEVLRQIPSHRCPPPASFLLGSPDPCASQSISTVSSEWPLVRKVGVF